MRQNPNMERASTSARATYELDTVVEKSAELTLAQVIDAVLNTATESRVGKRRGDVDHGAGRNVEGKPGAVELAVFRVPRTCHTPKR